MRQITEALRSFENINERIRGNVSDVLAETLVAGSKCTDLPEKFLKVVSILVNESREELVTHIYALAPVLHALGGTGSVEHAMAAVRKVSQWWP